MTEDTRKWANADAQTLDQLRPGITDFNVAQELELGSRRQEQESGFSREELEDAQDKVSRPQWTPERAP